MKKKLSIKSLLVQAWKSFVDNFTDWLFLFGMQAIVVVGFLLCCAVLLAVLHYFFIDLSAFRGLLSGHSKVLVVGMISVVSIFILFFTMAFPIMYKQNALDAVFGRPMSGFDVHNRFFSYSVGMFLYWMIVSLASCSFVFPGIFLAQRWRFVGLYLLDHGGSVRRAFRLSWQMTRGYVWFLVGVSMIQWLLFVFCSSTILFFAMAVALNKLIDANIYKQLHMEYDKDLSLCSCEA